MLVADRKANAMDMISRVKFKIPFPLGQLKHKTGLVSESICKWLGGWWLLAFALQICRLVAYSGQSLSVLAHLVNAVLIMWH